MTTRAQAEYDARRALERQRQRQRSKRVPVPASLVDGVKRAPCAVCGSRRRVEVHHIVPRSSFARGDESVHTPCNHMALCKPCHTDHHTTPYRVPRRVLTREAVQFVVERKGVAWLELWYPR